MTNETEWIVEFSNPAMPEPIEVHITSNLIIGRGERYEATDQIIDLTAYGAVEKGVSRQHTKLFVKDNELKVVDLDTANGTMLNERRLVKDEANTVKSGDTLVLGAFKLTVRIISQPDAAVEKANEKERLGKGEIVLIVEDHAEVAQIFSTMLQRMGFVTQISRDATRAMQFLRSYRPAAVILDIMLPGMDGLEVCRYIRRDISMDKTPIIIVTASRDDAKRREAKLAGADMYLQKPIKTTELGRIVADAIKTKNQATGPLSEKTKDKDQTKYLESYESEHTLKQNVTDDTVAVIIGGFEDKSFTVRLNSPKSFGRADGNSNRNHIDLSRFNAGDMGVSRVHMVLSFLNGKFYVEDNGSMNGTFINDEQLTPHQPIELHSGQDIRLGDLSMRVYFRSD